MNNYHDDYDDNKINLLDQKNKIYELTKKNDFDFDLSQDFNLSHHSNWDNYYLLDDQLTKDLEYINQICHDITPTTNNHNILVHAAWLWWVLAIGILNLYNLQQNTNLLRIKY